MAISHNREHITEHLIFCCHLPIWIFKENPAKLGVGRMLPFPIWRFTRRQCGSSITHTVENQMTIFAEFVNERNRSTKNNDLEMEKHNKHSWRTVAVGCWLFVLFLLLLLVVVFFFGCLCCCCCCCCCCCWLFVLLLLLLLLLLLVVCAVVVVVVVAAATVKEFI